MSEPTRNPYSNDELAVRAALATRDGDTRDADSFFALSVNREIVDAAFGMIRAAAKQLPAEKGERLLAALADLESKRL